MTAADCWADRDALREAIARVIEPDAERMAVDAAWADNRRHWRAVWENAFSKAESILKLIEAARHSQPGAEGGKNWLFVRQEADAAFCFLHECWVGTGQSMEEGTASHDFQVWKGRMHAVWSLADDMLASPQQPATSTDEKVGR